MKINRWRFLLLALALVPFAGLAAQQKYALIIGNNNYPASIGALKNPISDASAVAAKLRTLGFRVDLQTNTSLEQMSEAIERHRRNLSANRDNEGFFWYAGHGVQVDNSNYLLPVDVKVSSASSLKFSSYPADQLLATLEEAENAVNVVILDACRNNPMPAGTRGTSRGLAVITNTPPDMIVMYSTAAGQVAQDGENGRHSPFTEAFLQNIDKAEPLTLVLQDISAETFNSTNKTQSPWTAGTFRSKPRYTIARAAPSPQPAPAPVLTAPQAPRNVRAGTPGTDSVSLTWDSAGSGVSYKVYYGTQNDASRASVLNNVTSGTSMNVSGMASASTYYFWVTAVQNGQESGKSPVLTIRTAAVPVNPPSADMVRIPAGTFTMGSPANEAGRWDQDPQHSVSISKAFFMSKYEVTQREWVNVMGSNPSNFKGDNLPVERVSWFDVIDYCNKRSVKEGLTQAYTRNGDTVTWNRNANGYRLPTEAEWEYACRAGTTTPYSSGSSVDTAGWHSDNSGKKTHPVGTKQANAWGLYDMHGNVLEWCWDWHGAYSSGSQTDPMGAASGSLRVFRGGGWGSSAAGLRSAYRYGYPPSDRDGDLGFRVVRP
ncbi:SUMF1/EgtB/PvdO family nonheme iron enzyme [Breznakiellaceae bacterium SP9]